MPDLNSWTKSRISRALLCSGLLAGVAACVTGSAPTGPVSYAFNEETITPRVHDEPFPNWPVNPEVAEENLATARAEVLDVAWPGGGRHRRVRLHLEDPERQAIFKWKEAPREGMDGIDNAPRKEVAAYRLQQLFLEPEDYVVPTTVVRCVAVDRIPGGEPTLPGSRCVFGMVAVWLGNVTVPDDLYDPIRFERDVSYAYHIANLNLFTYLFEHQNARKENFIVSIDEERRQVFSVDNATSMNRWPWYNWFVRNWDRVRVPALRRESVERLGSLVREDLEGLAVLQQFERDAQGLYPEVPSGAPLDPEVGVRVRDGVVQFGLTRAEIDAIHARIGALLEDVQAGKVALF